MANILCVDAIGAKGLGRCSLQVLSRPSTSPRSRVCLSNSPPVQGNALFQPGSVYLAFRFDHKDCVSCTSLVRTPCEGAWVVSRHEARGWPARCSRASHGCSALAVGPGD